MTLTLLSPKHQHDGELGLLLGGGGSGAGGGAATATARSGGNAELLFHVLDQLGQLEHGHVGDGVEDFCFG